MVPFAEEELSVATASQDQVLPRHLLSIYTKDSIVYMIH